MFQDNPFAIVSAVLALAAAIGAAGLKLRQPLVISFLLAGVLVGPSGLRLVEHADQIELFANIGIAILLFVVGLRLDVGMIRTVGKVALATGIGQVAFTSVIGLAIGLLMGMSFIPALYVAVALTFSSTIIIVKLLSDKKEIDSLHGRISVGFLIVQDIAAILALVLLTALGGQQGGTWVQLAWKVLLKGLGFMAAVAVMMRWVIPVVLRYVARSQELLALAGITWAVLLAVVAEILGFSKEVGAFLAGVSLASTEQRDAIGARLVVLRDFLLLFFFIDLGARLDLAALGTDAVRAALFSLFVLVGNPLIVMAIMGVMGYRKRTGFMCGLAVAQISEFSLILGALGVRLGHMDAGDMNLITLVGILTICASTYMILYSGPIYNRLAPYLNLFERRIAHRESALRDVTGGASKGLFLLLGLGNYGTEIAHHLRRRDRTVLAVDFDPHSKERGAALGVPVIYGDASDPEVLAQLPLADTRWIVSTMRDRELSLALMRLLRDAGYAGRIAVTAAGPADVEALRYAGANEVLRPFTDAAEQAAETLTGAVYALPSFADWPVDVREVSLYPGSAFAGRKLGEMPIRRDMGVSVAAVSRAGVLHLNPDASFPVFPGDRLALVGDPGNLDQAAEYLDDRQFPAGSETQDLLTVEEFEISDGDGLAGLTLRDTRLRKEYHVAAISLCRSGIWSTPPSPEETLKPGDRLLILGPRDAVARLQASTREPPAG